MSPLKKEKKERVQTYLVFIQSSEKEDLYKDEVM